MILTIVLTITVVGQSLMLCNCLHYKLRRLRISHALSLQREICKGFDEHIAASRGIADAVEHKLIQDCNIHELSLPAWNYWFYEKGMQTSTDDVLVALVALNQNIPMESKNGSFSKRFQTELTSGSPFYYIDMGCGVGSILLLVSHGLLKLQHELEHSLSILENITNICSIGIEVQGESAELARKSVNSLPLYPGVFQPNISIQKMDIRDIPSLLSDGFASDNSSCSHLQLLKGKCNLITANPPYFPHYIGTHSGDSQLKNARFELHGGIEDYCLAVKELLCPKIGLFVFSFCASAVAATKQTEAQCSEQRVQQALAAAGLKMIRRTEVLAGRWDSTEPMGCIYEAVVAANGGENHHRSAVQERQLDIRRMEISNKLNPQYYNIQRALNMAPRPLKRRKRSITKDDKD